MSQDKVVFGKWEAIALLVNLMGTQIVLGFPRLMAEAAGTAGWILVIYVSVIAFLVFTLISRLYVPFEGKDLIDIGEIVGGTAGRLITGILLLGYLTYITSIVLREFSEDMKVIILPQTPISFVTMFFISGMILAAYKGLEAIVRFNALAIPFILAGFILITAAVAPYYNISNIFPVLGYGPEAIFGRGFLKLSIFSALSILYLIYPHIKTRKNFSTVGYVSLAAASAAFLWGALSYQLTFPFPLALENFLPVYAMARLINYGRFFQRIESVFVIIWAASALSYLSFGLYFIVYLYKKTFKLEYYRPLIIPFAILVYTISLIPPNLITAIELESVYFRNYIWIITFGLPTILLTIANMRKSKQKGGNQS